MGFVFALFFQVSSSSRGALPGNQRVSFLLFSFLFTAKFKFHFVQCAACLFYIFAFVPGLVLPDGLPIEQTDIEDY
jgi:hypothetical protein